MVSPTCHLLSKWPLLKCFPSFPQFVSFIVIISQSVIMADFLYQRRNVRAPGTDSNP
jgi:hypothetical protein